MKSFQQFIFEARVSDASKKAHELGLVGDGHGYWVDKAGTRKGRTVKGQFQPLKPRKPAPEPKEKQPPAQEREAAPLKTKKEIVPQQPIAAPEPEPQPAATPQAGEAAPERQSIVLVFGRFNPPTIGHEKLLDRAASIASQSRSDFRVYPSRSEDPRKNPLPAKTKIKYMKMMFPEYANDIMDDKKVISIFDALALVNQEGYTDVTLVVGKDRLNEFSNLANKYNGQFYNFQDINVESAGDRDPDSDGVSGMSASKCRKFAADDDFRGFRTCIPRSLPDEQAEDLFRDVQKAMNVRPYQKHLYKEDVNLWTIAPKLDIQNLREEYKSNRIFPIGSLVENLNTGISGRIIRRGTNYVICLASEGVMFKSWITDISEKNLNI